MAPTTRRGPNTPVNNTNPNNMTPESIQAMIDQALMRNSTNGDGSHSSHGDNRRNVQIAHPCFYADFMKCQPLNFKGTEGVVGLTRWIEKMESVFNINGCAIENQVKFTTCTLLGAALTWSTSNTNVDNTQKGNGAAPKGNGCFGCGAPRHFKRDCPKLKNEDGGNGNCTRCLVYAVGNAEKKGNASGNPDANVVTGTFLLNNHYASILFDTGADRSFISTTFSSLINIAPTPLENCYDVELADGKLVRIDSIIRGCTLTFHWPSDQHRSKCPRTGTMEQENPVDNLYHEFKKHKEYMAKGCQVFLAQISARKEEDKSEGKQIKEVPIVRDFSEVFPEDLSGLPLARLVEF
ncbi:putative reverse transcriptase domain-containing protein [Tanacetum coccineum]